MHYVYLLRSESHAAQTYVGSTSNLRQRLEDHNSGKSSHTRKFVPWHIVAYIALLEKGTAERFEKYLKSGLGRAFANRHFVRVMTRGQRC